MKYQSGQGQSQFIPWQPSTWPNPPTIFDKNFAEVLEKIIQETILNEIRNIISDANRVNGSLEYRGHVVALAMLCAVDTISSYAFPKTKAVCQTCGRSDSIGPKYKKFIETFFPADYQPLAGDIYNLHRNSMVHSWNLFEAGILPGTEKINKTGVALSFGLLNFFDALQIAARNFLVVLPGDPNLQQASLTRFTELKASALP